MLTNENVVKFVPATLICSDTQITNLQGELTKKLPDMEHLIFNAVQQ